MSYFLSSARGAIGNLRLAILAHLKTMHAKALFPQFAPPSHARPYGSNRHLLLGYAVVGAPVLFTAPLAPILRFTELEGVHAKSVDVA